eukprot:174594-Amphidinium_carterae.1
MGSCENQQNGDKRFKFGDPATLPLHVTHTPVTSDQSTGQDSDWANQKGKLATAYLLQSTRQIKGR